MIAQEVPEELDRQGYGVDAGKLVQILKTLNLHLAVLGEKFYSLKKKLGKDWKTVKDLLDSAFYKNIHREAIQIVRASGTTDKP